MKHWAYDLIGLPWSPERNCWWLVRECCAIRFGVHLPEEAAGVLALTEAAHVSGFRLVTTLAEVDDIVLMKDVRSRRHVGWFAQANGKVGVLHNDGHLGVDGDSCVGQVSFDTLHSLAARGMKDFEFWRRTK